MPPIEEYRSRLSRFSAEKDSAARTYHRLGNARLATGLALVAVGAMVFGPAWLSPWWLLAPLLPLIGMIVIFPSVDRALTRATRAVAYYERGLARLEDGWRGAGSPGENLRDSQHLYADDLDLFGRGSLFDLLSAARTATGERTLAGWLLAPGEVQVVRDRQASVQELISRLDLRQDVALTGEAIRVALDDRTLAAWGRRPAVVFFAGARVVAFLLALAAVITLGMWWYGGVSLLPFLIVGLGELVFMAAIRRPVFEVIAAVNTPSQELQLIAMILERIESESFTSPDLTRLQGALAATGKTATQQIRRLQRLVEWMEWSNNQVFAAIGAVLLWVPQFAIAIEAWRQECGPHVGAWIAAVGEFEALESLACFAYERPTATFPELIAEAVPVFEATGLAHPLLAPEEAIGNDVCLSREVPLWIVSGSNMSGKSTLLRAVGLSVAMAWAGAPVTAKHLRLSRLQLGASLRTNDSLADHKSRFYAEISRLKQIVDVASQGKPLLFLVDELLSGTNSHDRRIGAEALLHGLIERGAVGLATTHDLALTEMAGKWPGRALNVHLEDQIENGQIHFDYHLRPGVVERSNALELMRAVGLDV